MSCKDFVTSLVALLVAGGLTTAGCGSDSPTSPPTAQPPAPPAPPPAPTVSRIDISPEAATLVVGKTQGFVATAKASDGAVISGVSFTWSSSNTTVVTISSAGVASAVSVGTATIRASGNGITGAPATVTVTLAPITPAPVTPAPVASVTVSPSTPQRMTRGDILTFTAKAMTADGTAIDEVEFTWMSDDNEVATVDSTGLIRAIAAGTANITAMAEEVTSEPVSITVAETPPPPPQLKRRTATISGTPSYPNTAGSVTFEEVAGGKLKITVTGMDDGGGVQAHLFLYTSSSISWRTGDAVPDGARHFGDVTNDPSYTDTFTPSTGETIDSYSYVILHCALVNMKLGSGSLSN